MKQGNSNANTQTLPIKYVIIHRRYGRPMASQCAERIGVPMASQCAERIGVSWGSADFSLMPLSVTPQLQGATTRRRGSWRMCDAGHTRPKCGHPRESCRQHYSAECARNSTYRHNIKREPTHVYVHAHIQSSEHALGHWRRAQGRKQTPKRLLGSSNIREVVRTHALAHFIE